MPENGEIVSKYAQTDFASLTVIVPSPKGRSHVSLEHAEYSFDLPTLAKGFLGESFFHQLTIFPSHRPGHAVASRSPAISGRNSLNRDGLFSFFSFPTYLLSHLSIIGSVPNCLMLAQHISRFSMLILHRDSSLHLHLHQFLQLEYSDFHS